MELSLYSPLCLLGQYATFEKAELEVKFKCPSGFKNDFFV
jgi:hypothetical protein